MKLNQPRRESDGNGPGPSLGRTAVVEQLDRYIHEIRQLPGYEGFLHPPSSDELKNIIQEGIIIVIDVNDIRSDAILVTTSSIRALSLPHLRSIDVET